MNSVTPIIAIVGMPGSGKTLACDFLKTKGYPVLRFGDETDLGLKAQGLPLTAANEKNFRENLRKELGMAAYAIKIAPRIKATFRTFRSGSECIILDGLYSWEEYLYLKKLFPQLTLLCIYARPEIRYQRLAVRPIRPLTLKEARKRDIAELENLNKGGPIAIADYLITNNADEPTLYHNLEKLLSNNLQDPSL
ncbi:MAG: AAA family ATPase [Candidatus Beckwithbacteria bacterium]